MDAPVIVGALVAGFAVASIALPFFFEPSSVSGFSLEEVEKYLGPRKARNIIGALLLMVLMTGAIYVAFDSKTPSRFALGWFGVFILILLSTVLVPRRIAMKFLAPALKLYLVLLGLMLVLFGLFFFWTAGIDGRIPLARLASLDRMWVYLSREPYVFWFSVAINSVCVCVLTAYLREYFLGVIRK